MQESETNLEFLRWLVEAGVPVIWANPVLDSEGNWLPEIVDESTGEVEATGTWNGYHFPKWRDPTIRERHRISRPEDVDYFYAKEPRPAFLLLTGHVFDGVDFDMHADDEHPEREAQQAAVLEALGMYSAARIVTPSGGQHFYGASTGRHSESNVHTRVDYRGVGGLIALPGTLRRTSDGDVTYNVVDWTPENAATEVPVEVLDLLDQYRVEFRNCAHCRVSLQRNSSMPAGVALGDGEGWEALDEELEPVLFDDPFADVPARDLADSLLTWREILAPWFNVVGVRGSDLVLIRAGKAAEGRAGKSAMLHVADNRCVIYSADFPVETNTQLSKLDVYCALKEMETPGDAPADFAENLKYLRDRWAGTLYHRAGINVPRYLRVNCADPAVERQAPYPTLPGEFWENHPLLKQMKRDCEMRGTSPEAVLAAVLVRTLLKIGHQVVLPPQFGTEAELGATLNTGLVIAAPTGEGKGEAENQASAYVPIKGMKADPASGQSFNLLFGVMEKKDPSDPLAGGFKRTHWSRYLQYDEMDRFKNQMGQQNSTLSSQLRSCLTSDYLSERIAINRDSRGEAVDGFRICFTAHAQPVRLDWLMTEEDSGGFPQRLWYAYAAGEMPAEEYLDPDFQPPVIEPVDLNMPSGWELPDTSNPTPERTLVPLPRVAREQIRRWRWNCETGDQRGMLCVREKSYAALLVLLDGTTPEEAWELATQFHDYSKAVKQYIVTQIDQELRRKRRIDEEKKLFSAKFHAAGMEEHVESKTYESCKTRVLDMLSDGPLVRRQMANRISKAQKRHLTDVLNQLVEAGTLEKTLEGYKLA